MKYPTLPTPSNSREMINVFKGYNHNLRINDNEFFDMKNMTSDYYPALAPRSRRGERAFPENVQGMIGKDQVCCVAGSDFVVGTTRIPMKLNDEPKELISMGGYVIILPDKKYVNTHNYADWGSIDQHFTSMGDVKFELCDSNAEVYKETTASDTAPENPENMALWIDTSVSPHLLKKYSATSEMWISIATTYIKISSPDIGKQFRQYDGVTVSGISRAGISSLNGAAVIWNRGTDYIVVTGIIDETDTLAVSDGTITIERKMPDMDYVIESGNRLWGCRYGRANNGEMLNEIYASKLGDFFNWNCNMGLSTDSYTASCGTDGAFTGAVTHRGYPLFFKENCVHKVYGSYPSNFQIQATALCGVQNGCGKSLAIVNGTLFYKSRNGVYAYDGAQPVDMSMALGAERYSGAVAVSHGKKYYISMHDSKNEGHLFVYDSEKEIWHKEDDFAAKDFLSWNNHLFAVRQDGKIVSLVEPALPTEEKVEWMAETGTIGIDMPDAKYISRLTIRVMLEIGTKMRIYVQYDSSGHWRQIYAVTGTNLRRLAIPIRPMRCDNFKLRIEGEGDARILSITKTVEEGSDIS